IRYELRSPAQATLNVYDVTGNLVRTLARGTRAAGFYAVEWDGKDNSAARVRTGVYVYKLTAGKASQSGKMIFLR
ncbi:MAG: FlgD immunoglobulin-like domain containing protein, partial [bacterium]